MFDDGTTKDLLLLGDMTLSKDVIVKALWQSQQSGVWVVKRKGLCPLPLLSTATLCLAGSARLAKTREQPWRNGSLELERI
jgi:hypothetical protein